jgi:hypothetical protein
MKRSRPAVRFNVNELRESDADSAAQVEEAIRSAVADLPPNGRVECGVFAAFDRIHVRLDRPGWLGVFSLEARNVPTGVREAAVQALSGLPRGALLQ